MVYNNQIWCDDLDKVTALPHDYHDMASCGCNPFMVPTELHFVWITGSVVTSMAITMDAS